MIPSRPLMMIAALAAFGAPVAAMAQDVPAPFATAPFATAPVEDTTLSSIAGREDTRQAATATQTAGVADSSVGDNVRTGDARIADNAFSNLSGLSVLNVNTGNNVAINAAMNVNIAIIQPQ